MNRNTPDCALDGSSCRDWKFPHRSYFCPACEDEVIICPSCDRGNIYCPVCKPVKKAQTRKLSQSRYRKSDKGRIARKEQSRRYRKRKRLSESEGHHGSVTPHDKVTASESAMLPTYRGELHEPIHPSSKPETPAQKERFSCSFCAGACLSLSRRLGEWRRPRGPIRSPLPKREGGPP